VDFGYVTDRAQKQAQEQLAEIVPNAKHITNTKSGHDIHKEQPQLVIDSIRRVVDLFVSADIAYPRKLAEKGLGADDVFLYAIGRIVVWVPKDSPVAVDKLGIKALLEPSVRKIAVANLEHAPYGRAAVAAMKALNVYDQVASRLVYGENIAQTAQFVQSGAADIGILALSLAVAPQMRDAGRFWQVPPDAYPRIEQGGIILKSSRNLETARAFRDFVLGDHGREVLEHYGFYLPGK
jgi:molybdate transport system substrate-binding protein